MDTRINTAIIGFGTGGSVFHAPIINSLPEFSISKIYTTNAAKINKAKERYPDAEIVSDVKDIFLDTNISLVVIAVPNSFHSSLALDAINAGKHVVIDKPFTVESEDADNLIKLATQKHIILSVYHNRRWDSDFRTVKKVVDSKLLGNIVECEIHFDRFRNYIKENSWKEKELPGSGMLYDLGSHLIDQAQCLFGLPSNITADLRVQRKESIVTDSFEIIMDYPGLKVTLKSGILVREPLPHHILLGDKGSFIKYGMDVQEADLNIGLTPLTKADWGKESENLQGIINTSVNGLNIRGKVESERGDYREYYKNIYKAITGQEELAVKPLQARNTIKIIELAMESSMTRRTVEFRQ